MRVISGSARGVRIDNIDNGYVRPTTDKVKESIFNIIQFDIQGKVFLDLFGGTGQIGIEAASRGAEKTVIVELRRDVTKLIRENIKKSRLSECIEVVNSDALDYLKNTSLKFDFSFVDPPYGDVILNDVLFKLTDVMNDTGVIITETSKEQEVLREFKNFVLCKQYVYGRICINKYKNSKITEGEI